MLNFSLGNATQSTNISTEGRQRERRHKGSRNLDSLDRMNPKSTVVVSNSTSGDNFETRIKQ